MPDATVRRRAHQLARAHRDRAGHRRAAPAPQAARDEHRLLGRRAARAAAVRAAVRRVHALRPHGQPAACCASSATSPTRRRPSCRPARPPCTPPPRCSTATRVAVLALPEVIDGPGHPGALSTARFARDVRMLEAAGYHAVVPEQVVSWLDGKTVLPENAVLLTFDARARRRRAQRRAGAEGRRDAGDGLPHRRGVREEPGLVLEPRAAARAGAPLRLVDRRLRGREPRRGRGRGRRLVPVPLRAGARRGPRRASAPAPARSTPARCAPPTTSARRPAIAYAWPYGAWGGDRRANDAGVGPINLEEARQVFRLGFTLDAQESFRLLTRGDDPMRVARLAVSAEWTPAELLERLNVAAAASAPVLDMRRRSVLIACRGGRPAGRGRRDRAAVAEARAPRRGPAAAAARADRPDGRRAGARASRRPDPRRAASTACGHFGVVAPDWARVREDGLLRLHGARPVDARPAGPRRPARCRWCTTRRA